GTWWLSSNGCWSSTSWRSPAPTRSARARERGRPFDAHQTITAAWPQIIQVQAQRAGRVPVRDVDDHVTLLGVLRQSRRKRGVCDVEADLRCCHVAEMRLGPRLERGAAVQVRAERRGLVRYGLGLARTVDTAHALEVSRHVCNRRELAEVALQYGASPGNQRLGQVFFAHGVVLTN